MQYPTNNVGEDFQFWVRRSCSGQYALQQMLLPSVRQIRLTAFLYKSAIQRNSTRLGSG